SWCSSLITLARRIARSRCSSMVTIDSRTDATSPNCRSASCRAASYDQPAATRRSIRVSRWNDSSSSTSRDVLLFPKGTLKTRRMVLCRFGCGGRECLAQGARVPLPEAYLGAQLRASRATQLIELCPAIVVGVSPLRREPAVLLQAVQG